MKNIYLIAVLLVLVGCGNDSAPSDQYAQITGLSVSPSFTSVGYQQWPGQVNPAINVDLQFYGSFSTDQFATVIWADSLGNSGEHACHGNAAGSNRDKTFICEFSGLEGLPTSNVNITYFEVFTTDHLENRTSNILTGTFEVRP